MEVMSSRPRSDIYINLPTLKNHDALLLSGRALCGLIFCFFNKIRLLYNRKYWKVSKRQSFGMWNKGAYQVIHEGDHFEKFLRLTGKTRNGGCQFLACPPKRGTTSVGDIIYKYITSGGKFSPEHLLDSLNISSEHEALELADRVESSMYTWRRKACAIYSKSSWEMVKIHVAEIEKSDKNVILAERADSFDVGQAILESYSRVLEGLAFNIVAWINDLLFEDKSASNQET
ncbi:Rop guanine nucleotide exchange factor 3-like protein [Tanacetum coccineum]